MSLTYRTRPAPAGSANAAGRVCAAGPSRVGLPLMTSDPGRLTVRRPAAFWLVAIIFAIAQLGTTLPTPLYVIYQAQWHFSAGTVTIIFATYAAGVLFALLVAGRSSDQAGRRPVLLAALGFSAIS